MIGVVPTFSRTPGSIADVGPTLGEHTEHYR
jgi:crotonobetainyl-CoA:carnitine CoA-transferase CaiB-like acyl-CoA transferase